MFSFAFVSDLVQENAEISNDLPNQLMEVSNKRKSAAGTTSSSDPEESATTELPATTMPRVDDVTTTQKPEVRKLPESEKGQNEVMMARPATPIKHPYSPSLEQQLSSFRNTKQQVGTLLAHQY